MNIGLVGYGYWGPNLARNIVQNENTTLIKICDLKQDRLNIAKQLFPFIKTTISFNDLLNDSIIDAVVISTPVNQHFSMAKKALEKGKHVLIEKPISHTVKEAEILVELAYKKNLILMVDHIFMYNGVVSKIKNLIDNKDLGSVQYIDSTRINLGIFQNDINVILDLATHDISIINYLISEKPISVIATGKCHTGNNIENLAYITLNYQSNLIAHIHCSWSSPVKVRQMLIGGDKKMLIYNDIEPTEKLKIYDKSFLPGKEEDKHKVLTDYRTGDVYIPKYDTTEPLQLVVGEFYKSVISGQQPLSNGLNGLEVIKIIELANRSLLLNGKEIIISN